MAASFHSVTSESAESRRVVPTSERDRLLEEVRGSISTLSALALHGEHLGETVVTSIQSTIADTEARLVREELVLAIAGAKGSGKTTFINALAGTRLLTSVSEHIRVTLRNGSTHHYTVRFGDGREEHFDDRFPDTSNEMIETRDAADHALIKAAERRERLAEEIEAGKAAVAHARAGLSGAFTTFEAAREQAARVHADLESAQATQSRLEKAVADRRRALPGSAVESPPVWAIWLWILRFLLVLVHRGAVRSYREAHSELTEAQRKVDLLRSDMDRAAQACARAEADLSPSASPAESAHAELDQKRAEWSQLEARIQALEHEARQARTELERIRTERPRRFFEDVQAFCDPSSEGQNVVELDITCPTRHLPDDMILIYAPAMGAPDKSEQEPVWASIRESADGCLFLADLERGITGETPEIVRRARDAVPYLLLVLTKMDESFKRAVRRRDGEPRKAVEQARRVETRRFAQEIGRNPTGILSVAVAAEAALKEGEATGLSRRFAGDVEQIFRKLREERALMLGVRAARRLQGAIRDAAVAQQQAERSYQQKLLRLLEERTPEPNRFRKEQLESAQPVISEKARSITRSATGVMRAGMHVIRTHCADRLASGTSRAELRELARELEQVLVDGIAHVQLRVYRHLEEKSGAVVRDLEARVFDALRKRYDIAPDVERWTNPSIHLEEPAPPNDALSVAVSIERAVRSFELTRWAFGVGGAVVGGLLGSLIFFGIGTAVGMALGTLLLFARTYAKVRVECTTAIEKDLKQASATLAERVDATKEAIAGVITESVDASVARASIRYGKWIAAPLEAERAALVSERERLHALQALRERLRVHDERLSEAIVTVSDASSGLCGPSAIALS